MRPKLLNSSFLYVRGVLNQVLSQFLPHGKHVLACLCTDLRAIVAEQPVSTPCLCASQTCSIDRRPQPGVSYRTSAQGATASVCKSKGGRKRPVVKLRRLCRGRNCRKTWQFLTAVGECVKGASPRTVKAWVRRQSVPSAVRVVPLGWGRCADGTCEARYVRMQKLSCPLRARWQAARRIGQNRARKRVARRGRRQRSGSFRVRTGRAYHSAAVRGARFARGRGRQWIHCQQRQCCTPRGKIKNARDAQASGRMLSACQDKSEHGMAPAGRRPCAERPSSRTQWLRDQGDSLDSKANIRRPKAQDARAAIGAKSNDTGGACDCGRKNRVHLRGGAPSAASSTRSASTARCFFCDSMCAEQHDLNFTDHYLCRCRTCRRRVCNFCAEQELGSLYCPWCVENRVAALEGARSIARLRTCAKQHCSWQEDREYAYVVQVVQLCAANKTRAETMKGAEACFVPSHRMRMRTGGASGAPAGPGEIILPELLEAALLSVLGDPKKVASLLQQEWAKEWHGWADVATAKTDSAMLHLAQRLLRLAETNAAVEVPSNEERLEMLRREGWRLCHGHAHGANNCLLDSLLVALADAEVLPRSLHNNVSRRAKACAACRATFVHGPNASLHPQERDWRGRGTANARAYLELDRHGPPAAMFLYEYITGRAWPATVAVDVIVYTRFDNANMNPEAWPLRLGGGMRPADCVVRLYNHMDERGNGYHFDALVATASNAQRATSGDAAACRDVRRHVEGRPSLPAAAAKVAAGSRLPQARLRTEESARGQYASWTPSLTEMLAALDAFLVRRGAEGIRANHSDAVRAVAAWDRQDDLAALLQTLLQAGLQYSDLTRVGARKVAAELRGFVWTCHSGPGRTLGASAAKPAVPSGAAGHTPRTDQPGRIKPARDRKGHAASEQRRGRHAHASALTAVAVEGKRAKAGKGARNRGKGASAKRSSGKHRRSASRTGGNVAPGAPKRRRYSVKQPRRVDEPPKAQQDVRDVVEEDHFILRTRPPAATSDPRACADVALAALADLLLEYPTLPKAAQSCARSRAAVQIADVHCAFATCGWTGGCETELQGHVLGAHAACLRPAAAALRGDIGSEATLPDLLEAVLLSVLGDGDGYHFDALVATAADAARLPQTSPATPGARRAAASHAADAARNAVARAAAGPSSAQSLPAADTPSPWADSSAGRIAAEQRAQWAPSLTKMLSALDAFLARRGAGGIRANRADAARTVAASNRQDELAVLLQTLLQAGLTYSDLSRVTARKVAAEFRGFVWTFHAGAGRTLGAQAADAAAPSKTVAPSGADPPPPCSDQQTKAKGKRPAQTKGKGGRARAIAAAATAATKKHKAKAPKSRRSRKRGAGSKPLSRRRRVTQKRRFSGPDRRCFLRQDYCSRRTGVKTVERNLQATACTRRKILCWQCSGDTQRKPRLEGGGALPHGAVKKWEELPKAMQKCFRGRNVGEHDSHKLHMQDWCREWRGWADITANMRAEEAQEWVARFLLVVRQNRDIKRTSNEERLAELARDGLLCHKASARGNNCLIDSLALGLAAQGFIPRELVHDSDARIQVCEDCRQMLVSAPDENLRPRWLDRRGRPRQLSAREHANAFLQPDCHSRAILHFLLEYYDNRSAAEQNDFRIVAYTPSDGAEVDPFDGAVMVRAEGRERGTADLCTLHIYNYQDAEANSYHFDALLTESARNSNAAKSSQGSTAASAGAPKATPSPKAGAGCQRTDDAKNDSHGTSLRIDGWSDTTARGHSTASQEKNGRQPVSPLVCTDEQVQSCLQAFFTRRGCTLQVTSADTKEIRDAWSSNKSLGKVLLTKLQASVCYSDSGFKAQENLAAAFRRFFFCSRQGGPRKLGGAEKDGQNSHLAKTRTGQSSNQKARTRKPVHAARASISNKDTAPQVTEQGTEGRARKAQDKSQKKGTERAAEKLYCGARTTNQPWPNALPAPFVQRRRDRKSHLQQRSDGIFKNKHLAQKTWAGRAPKMTRLQAT